VALEKPGKLIFFYCFVATLPKSSLPRRRITEWLYPFFIRHSSVFSTLTLSTGSLDRLQVCGRAFATSNGSFPEQVEEENHVELAKPSHPENDRQNGVGGGSGGGPSCCVIRSD